MVFQNYALYPHMSVYRNLSFGMELRFGGGLVARGLRRIVNPRRAAELAVLRRSIDLKVRQAAERLNIQGLLSRKPHQLSGGERQRVALGRAIVREPAAFLFDEPLSNLDAKLRQQMRSELKLLHQSLNATMIYVTHDQIEAMTLGSRVAVMDRGRLQQVADPQTVYHRPANLFVASFFGSTPINLVEGQLTRDERGWVFECEAWKWVFRIPPQGWSHDWPAQVTLGFRGENINLVLEGAGSAEFGSVADGSGADVAGADRSRWVEPIAWVRVRELDRWGDATVVHLDVPDASGEQRETERESDAEWRSSDRLKTWYAKLPSDVPWKRRDRVGVQVAVEHCLWFDTATGMNLSE
jgi:ABC-type sugar transport system ATPase subunit